jgi:lysyl-tRNA synthetase class 2
MKVEAANPSKEEVEAWIRHAQEKVSASKEEGAAS